MLNRPYRSLANTFACAFALALGVTLVAAFAPQADAPHLSPWDKANHFLAFYVLSILCAAGFPRLKLAYTAAGLLALGAIIEIVQATPLVKRDGDLLDWIADSVGVGFALAPSLLVVWRERCLQDGA